MNERNDSILFNTRNTCWTRGLIITGIVIAVLNMTLAWLMMFSQPHLKVEQAVDFLASQSKTDLSITESDTNETIRPDTSTRIPRPVDKTDSWNRFFSKLLEMAQEAKQSEERQTILLLGFCFALISIGFSLFVMGVEGVAGLKGDIKEFGTLAIKVSSPGLFCIFLASTLIGLGLIFKSTENDADLIRAEYEGKENILWAEANTKEQIIEAKTRSKLDLIEAETLAKERIFELELEKHSKKSKN